MKRSISGKSKPALEQNQPRLAPRSQAQFKVGPSFNPTVSVTPLFTQNGVKLDPIITARTDRGFDLEKGEWIGYKRNYFALVASFQFRDAPLSICQTDGFLAVDSRGKRRKVSCFKLGLFDICMKTGTFSGTLIQHTSKRDKGPQFQPPVYYAVPGTLPSHDFMKSIANIRSSNRLSATHNRFYLASQDIAKARSGCVLRSYPKDAQVAKVARYERIQFSSVQPKLVSGCNRSFKLMIKLMCDLDNGETVVLATTETPVLVIRGRSPSTYQEENSSNNKKPGLSSEDKENQIMISKLLTGEGVRRAQIREALRSMVTGPNNTRGPVKGGPGAARSSLGTVIRIDDLLSPPMECSTPQKQYFVTLRMAAKPSNIDSTLQSLAKAGESITSTPKELKNATVSLVATEKLEESESLTKALEEYEAAKQKLSSLMPHKTFGLNLPVPLELLSPLSVSESSNVSNASDILKSLPPTMGEPVRYCKHGCKKREGEVDTQEMARQLMKEQVQSESTSFLEENSNSSLLRFKSSLDRIKPRVIPDLFSPSSPLTNMSSSYDSALF